MATIVKVEVPDIGDFKDVPVIEVLVKAGEAISAETPLVTLESDKATMDVPAPLGGNRWRSTSDAIWTRWAFRTDRRTCRGVHGRELSLGL